MRKIKDFFYNISDVLIVLIIVAAAAFLIYNRIDAIMDYPAKYAKEMETSTTEQVIETTKAEKATQPSTDSSDEEN